MSKLKRRKYNPTKAMAIVFFWAMVELFLLSSGLNLADQPDDLLVGVGYVVLLAIPVTSYFTIRHLLTNYK